MPKLDFLKEYVPDIINRRASILNLRKKKLERQRIYLERANIEGVERQGRLDLIQHHIENIDFELACMKANNPKERSQVVVEKMKKDINDPEANRAWHRKHRRMKSQLDRIGRIIDWEINKDNARPENKDRKWAIERLIEKNIILNVKKTKLSLKKRGRRSQKPR
jgi:hypothetical protein